MLCSYCERGTLQPRKSTERFAYKGQERDVPGYTYSVCDECGQEITTAEQMKVNQRLIADEKRRADGLMTSTAIKALRDKLDLSQADASKIFGGGPNAFYKYENGEVMQSVALDRLMVLARDDVTVYQRLRALAGLPDKHVIVPVQTQAIVIAFDDRLVRTIDTGQPPDAVAKTVQAFLGAVSNRSKPLVENVKTPAGWVH